MPVYRESTLSYLRRSYDSKNRKHICQAKTPGELKDWQEEARPLLLELLGLNVIAASVGDQELAVSLSPAEEMGSHTRRLGHIETEPDVRIPFWMLRPHGRGPFPLAITPHGHEPWGYDQYAGRAHDADMLRIISEEDGAPAIHAVAEGFLAIAPATRGLGCDGVPNINNRHGTPCKSQLMHCLIAGRTAIG